MIIEGIDFEEAASFYLEDKIKVRTYDKTKNLRHLVYAHTVDNEVVYIGETSNTFHKRMYYYCNHKGRTNVRVREHFKEQILLGKEIKTYIYVPQLVVIAGHKVKPYIGQKLIDLVKPMLNRKNVLT